VGWVIFDRSAGAERPHFLIAFSRVRNAFTLIGASRSAVRSLSRSTNAFAARLPVVSRLKNRNSIGSDRVRVARTRATLITAEEPVLRRLLGLT
jgi:hypothetical protein